MTECQALLGFFNDTDGLNWLDNSGWDVSNTPCTDWFGVICENGSVTELVLPNNQVGGTLPDNLSDLTELINLELFNNELTGPIPETLGDLSNVLSLDFENNEFSGAIPDSLGSLTNLEVLWLSDNLLTGQIPTTLVNLVNLTEIYLQDNNCLETSDTVLIDFLDNINQEWREQNNCAVSAQTDCAQVTEIPQAECQALLNLFNSTSGPDWLNNDGWNATNTPCSDWVGLTCDAGNVSSIVLPNNELNGPLPDNIGDLSELLNLELYNNQLGGPMPDTLGNLVQLISLDFENNELSGVIPDSLSNLANLETLWLSKNQLSGEIPVSLVDLSNLEALYLEHNNCLETSDASLTAFLDDINPNWRTQDGCSDSAIVQIDCTQVAEIPQAECLALQDIFNRTNGLGWLNNEGWTDSNTPCADWFGIGCEAGRVVALELPENRLTGSLPDSLSDLTELHYLRLFNNELGGSVPDRLGTLENLIVIELDDNELSGSIPSNLGALPNLEALWLNANRFSGQIPTSLSNLTNLEQLFLQENDCLTTENAALIEFLDEKNPEWQIQNNCTDQNLPQGETDCTEVDEIPQAQCAALLDFFNSTNGPDWLNNDGWNVTNTPCSDWHGIECDAGNVVTIVLNDNELRGSIPDSLSTLTDLVELVLYNNQLSGPIPDSLSTLSNLHYLDFENNQLNGLIPASLGMLVNLEALWLNHNQFRGEIPANLLNLTELEQLFLQENNCLDTDDAELIEFLDDKNPDWRLQNNCTDQLPPQGQTDCSLVTEIPVAECEALLELFNSTDGTNWATNFGWGATNTPCSDWHGIFCEDSRVTEIVLPDNQLNGVLPDSLATFTELFSLALYDNFLSGEIPTTLDALTNLINLEFDNNYLSGGIPANLGTLTSLESLWLNGNQLSGQIPAALTNLVNLDVLFLEDNNCLETSDSALMEFLDGINPNWTIQNNCAAQGQPQGQTNCSQVTEIPQTECEALLDFFVSTNGPGWLDNFGWNVTNTPCTNWTGVSCRDGRVQALSLPHNQLSGRLPDSLSTFTKLEGLELYNKELTGPIPARLSLLSNLVYLDFENNLLSGEIPESLGDLGNLEVLWLNGNRLSGRLPDTIANLSSLEVLYVENNNCLSTASSNLTTFLDGLSDNWRTQNNCSVERTNCNEVTEIPQAECTALLDFYNNTNGMEWLENDGWGIGNTPCSWVGVHCQEGHVKELFLPYNEISGFLPDSLGNLTAMTDLALYNNQLSGPLPDTFGDLTSLTYMDFENNALTGPIPETFNALTNLRVLWLNGNLLSGDIPVSLLNLPLTALFVEDNTCLTTTDPALATFLDSINPDWFFQNNCPGQQTNCSEVTEIPQAECAALLDFFNETNGLGWLNKTGWNVSNTPCSDGGWAGVSCTNGRVTQLNLPGNQLRGNLPESLSTLTELTHLQLGNNSLSEAIPQGLSSLTKLTHLQLNNNRMSGPIPDNLVDLTELTELALENNSCLATTNDRLIAFLNDKDLEIDWRRQNSCTLADLGIEFATLVSFDAARLASLSPNTLAAFSAAELARLPAAALQGLTVAQLTLISPETFSGLTAAQFNNLSSDVVGNISDAQLGSLSIDVLRAAVLNQVGNLNAGGMQTAGEQNLLRLIVNLDASQLTPQDITALLPDGWSIDATTGALLVPPGTQLLLRALAMPGNLPDNLTIPEELPDLNSSVGLGGEGGTSILAGMTQALEALGLTNIKLSQTSQGILVAELVDDPNTRLAFTVDTDQAIQGDISEGAGITTLPNGQIVLITPDGQQFALTPAPQDPAALAQVLATDGISVDIGENGDVMLLLPDGSLQIVLFSSAVVPSAEKKPGLKLLPPEKRQKAGPIGQVVFGNGSAQQIFPYVPEPDIFESLLLATFGSAIDAFIPNINDGTFIVRIGADSFLLTPLNNFQLRELGPREKVAPTLRLNADLTLSYTVQKEKRLLAAEIAISQ